MTATVTAPATPWTADIINRALFTHFARQSWACLFEVGAHAEKHEEAGRRIDALFVRKARRMGLGHHELLAIEVKVTRADFLQDVRRPEKQAAWQRTAHRHAYAVPKGLVTVDEVPAHCGLIEVDGEGPWHSVSWAKRAPYTDTATVLPSWLVATFYLRASWAEGRLKGWSGVHTYNTDGDTVEDLRGKLDAARKENDRLSNALTKAQGERDTWKAAYAAGGGLPCQFCGEQVKPGRLGRGGYFDKWVHVKRAHNELCEVAREKHAQDAAQARWDAMDETERAKWLKDRWYGFGDPPTAESIVRDWSIPPNVRPTDDLLPEGITPDAAL